MRVRRYGVSASYGLMAALAVAPVASGAFAQEQQAPVTQDGSVELEEIVITGRKRNELEEKAPVSVTVMGPDQVPPSTIDTGAAIARQSPNANFIDYSRFGENFTNIRGISTLGSPLNSLDSTVGFAVDGVPTSVSGFSPPLLDVEQIEVLRGPQGTTFGRNALGGVISVASRKADGEREFRLDSEIGSNGHAFVQGTAGGWIVPDKVAARGVVRFQKYDGDIPNPYLGEDLGDTQLGAARGTVRFTPDETLTIDVTGNYSRDERANPAYLLYTDPDFPVSGEDVKPEQLRTIAQGTINIAKEFDNFTLTSTTSYQDVGISNYADFTDAYVFAAITGFPPQFNPATDKVATDEKDRLFTQEVRLNSAEGADWQWVVGASYLHQDYRLHRVAGVAVVPTFNGTFDNRLVSDTYSAFGDVTVPVGERLKVSGGLRLSHDRQSLDGEYISNGFLPSPPFPAMFSQHDEVSDTYLTGRAAVSYEWNADVMSYASIARGYSSGGLEKSTAYAGFGKVSPPFEPAKGWTYELGTKANLTDRLSLRAAVFYNDIADGQLSGFNPSNFEIFMTNQDFRSYGGELSGAFELTDGLHLTAGLGYTKSEMVGITRQSTLAGAAEGNAAPQVPAWTGNVGLAYTMPGEALGLSGEFSASANYQFVGSRYSDLANAEKMDPYHVVNAKIGWENDRVGVHAFVNNLLDERPLSFSGNLAVPPFSGVANGVYVAGQGRVVGLGASVKF